MNDIPIMKIPKDSRDVPDDSDVIIEAGFLKALEDIINIQNDALRKTFRWLKDRIYKNVDIWEVLEPDLSEADLAEIVENAIGYANKRLEKE